MRMRRGWIGLLATCAVVALAPQANAGVQLAQNGGFETGDFSGWQRSGDLGNFGISGLDHTGDGAFSAFLGATGPSENVLSQTIATQLGHQYKVDFFLENTVGAPNAFKASFGSGGVSLTNAEQFGWQEFSFDVFATAPSTTLTFSAHNQPGFFLLDDVSVTEVPEPATAMILGAGLGLTGLRRNRRKDAPAKAA
jgi:hypothetical protein